MLLRMFHCKTSIELALAKYFQSEKMLQNLRQPKNTITEELKLIRGNFANQLDERRVMEEEEEGIEDVFV